jgi:methylenetetrahydrofolate dehydrogenase (NADP+)/methenyltetrahydrofolate cyclohydrolase
MTAKIIDGRLMAEEVMAEVAAGTEDLKKRTGIVPGLAVILAGENPASKMYVRSKGKRANKLGMKSVQRTLPASVTIDEVLSEIAALNADPSIHGILVQMPLPEHLDDQAIVRAIDPDKDVDGLHPVNLGRLLRGEDGLRPCTPLGIQRMLISAGVRVPGSHVVVVGRSNLVGKPVAALLALKGDEADATVTLCHSHTRDLPSITMLADILIAAIGKPEFITADMVKEGVVVIDVGINRVPDPSTEKGYRVVGDVKFGEVSAKCSAITPVPGGVGEMTVAMLLSNTLQAARRKAGLSGLVKPK